MEEYANQFRYHFGQLWDMIKNNDVRRYGLCSDGPKKFDYSKQWDQYSVNEQNQFIDSCMWGYSWNDCVKYKTPKSSLEKP